jgi:hypothetical protein
VITDFRRRDFFRISASGFRIAPSDPEKLTAGVKLRVRPASTGVLVNGTAPISNDPTFLYNNGVLKFFPGGNSNPWSVVLASLPNGPAALNANQFKIVT